MNSSDYPLDTHYAETGDGYIVTLLRLRVSGPETIVKNDTNNSNENGTAPTGPPRPRPAVLIVHGFLCSGDEWLMDVPEKVLPFMLAQEGYDCWLGCQRGSRLTGPKPHVKYTEKDRKFWDFCVDELGAHDIPAMIDYVLNFTKQESLHYVGHSLGTTALFIALSSKPEYHSKVKVMAALTPAVYGRHMQNFLIKRISAPSLVLLGKMKFFYRRDVFRKSSEDYVKMVGPCLPHKDRIGAWFLKKSCRILGVMCLSDQIEKNRLLQLGSRFPGRTSMKSLCHTMQGCYYGKFQAFNHGRSANMKRYGQPTPPEYDLKKITIPVAIFTSEHDFLIPADDVLQVSKELPNVIHYSKICEKEFNHTDFMVGKDAHKFVYKDIVKIFSNY